MKVIFVFGLIIFLFFLYCLAVTAKKADENMEKLLDDSDQNDMGENNR